MKTQAQQLSFFDTPMPVQVQNFDMNKLIEKANSTGQYHFPFKLTSNEAKIIVNDIPTIDEVLNIQKIWFKAALMVADKQFKGINEALRFIGAE